MVDYAKGQGKTTLVMSVDKPYDVQLYPQADAVLATFGCMGSTLDPTEALLGGTVADEKASGPNITAGIEVAFGVFGAQGKMPVSVPQYQNGSYTSQIVMEQGFGLTYNAKHTHSPKSVDDPEQYKEEFFECEGCGMWFQDTTGQIAIIDKFALLGAREQEEPQTPTDIPTEKLPYGDVNGDGKIDAKDALAVLKSAVGKLTLTGEQQVLAELNADGNVDAKDALLILRRAVEKIDKFPVEEEI